MTDSSAALSADKGRFTYIPALDGLRAVSIGLVMLSHTGLEKLVPGGFGVIVFFVISGFLLTGQMLSEIEATGTVNIPHFYVRRVLRLAPALLVYIALFTAILLHLGAHITLPQAASAIFYFANYYGIYEGYTLHNPYPILWSLAVEEHYYIFFPFLVLLLRRRPRRLLMSLCGLVLFALVWRIHVMSACTANPSWALCGASFNDRIFHGTDTIFDCILYGAITALALHCYGGAARRIISRRAFFAALGVLALTFCYRNPYFRETLRYSLQSMAVAVVILNVLYGEGEAARARGLLSLRYVRLVGFWSYSLYLYHFGVLNVLFALNHTVHSLVGVQDIVLYFVLSFLGAAASFYMVEQPVRKLRKRFRMPGQAPQLAVSY